MPTTQEHINELVNRWCNKDWCTITEVLRRRGRSPSLLDWEDREDGDWAPVFKAICMFVWDEWDGVGVDIPQRATGLEFAVRTAAAVCRVEDEGRIARVKSAMSAFLEHEAALSLKALDYFVAASLCEGRDGPETVVAARLRECLMNSITILLRWLDDHVRGFEWDQTRDPSTLTNQVYLRFVTLQDQGPCPCCKDALGKIAKRLHCDEVDALPTVLEGELPESSEVRNVLKCHNKHRLNAFLERLTTLSKTAAGLKAKQTEEAAQRLAAGLDQAYDIQQVLRTAQKQLELLAVPELEGLMTGTHPRDKELRKALLKRWAEFSLAALVREFLRNSYGPITAQGVGSGMIWSLLVEHYHLAFKLVAFKKCTSEACRKEKKESWSLEVCEHCGSDLKAVIAEAKDVIVVLDPRNPRFRAGNLVSHKRTVLFWLGAKLPPAPNDANPPPLPNDIGSDFLDYLLTEVGDGKLYAAAMAVVAAARRRVEQEVNAKLEEKKNLLLEQGRGRTNMRAKAIDRLLGPALDGSGFSPIPDALFLDAQHYRQWAHKWVRVQEQWRQGGWETVQDLWDALRTPKEDLVVEDEFSGPDDPDKIRGKAPGEGDEARRVQEVMDRFKRDLTRAELPWI